MLFCLPSYSSFTSSSAPSTHSPTPMQATCINSSMRVALRVYNLDATQQMHVSARRLASGTGAGGGGGASSMTRGLEQQLVESAFLRCSLEHANVLQMYGAFKVRGRHSCA